MWNVDQSNSLRLQLTHHLKEFFNLRCSQGWCRFIQYNDFGMIGNRFCDLAHLSLRYRHFFHWLGQIHCNSQFSEQVWCFFFHSSFVDHPNGILWVSSKEHVIYNTSFKTLVQLLVYHRHSVFQCILRAGEIHFFSVQYDGSFIFLIGSKEAFHHCRFSGTVFTHQSHNGSRFDIHADMFQNLISTERFAHAVNR